jgi:hypothetical protein
MDPLLLRPGYGFRTPSKEELIDRATALGLFVVFEQPRKRGPRRYVVAVDVADGLGIGGDRSVIQVIRVQTLDEPAEQVAEFASDEIEPGPLAYIVQAVGQYYTDEDGQEALVVVERTHHGLSTIDTLHLHLGYTNQYVWEYYNAKDPTQRFSQSLGWSTTPITRPILVDKFVTAVKTFDPITGQPDFVINSKPALDEMQDFQTEGALWEAAAARGAKDDRVMALGMGYVIAWRLHSGEQEPIDERRRRKHEQEALLRNQSGQPVKLDWRNTPASSQDAERMVNSEEEVPLDEQLNTIDDRSSDASAYGHGVDDWLG